MTAVLPIKSRRPVPPRALGLSIAALGVPVLYGLLAPDAGDDYGLLIWMTPLLPALLLSYYRGWRGAAGALAGGMVALSAAQVMAEAYGKHVDGWPILLELVACYVALTLGIGFVSEMLHRAREEAERLALTDELTGLPNRRYARLFLDKEFAAAQRGRVLSIVLFDLDRFKAYNDAYGHAAGDAALCAFARALEIATRKMNLSARYGGEEFLSMVSSTDTTGALVFVDRVRQQLALQHLPAGRLTVSAGVAGYQPTMRSADDLLAAADAALYRAKQDGRDCARVAGAPMAAAVAVLEQSG